MRIQTTINIDEAIRDTAKRTEAKNMRGGLSAYIERLMEDDLKKKSIKISVDEGKGDNKWA